MDLTFTLKIYDDNSNLIGLIDSLGSKQPLVLTNNGNYRFDYILNGSSDFQLNSYVIKDVDSNATLYSETPNVQVPAQSDYVISKNRNISTNQSGVVTVNEKMICDITIREPLTEG